MRQRPSLGNLRRRACSLWLLVLLLPAPARAEREILVTPFAGYLFGGSFQNSANSDVLYVDESPSFGLILDLLDTPRAYYELTYSFQRTELRGVDTPGWPSRFDLDIHYLHVGGMYEFPHEKVQPFIAGGLGLTALVPEGSDLGSSTNVSASLGGGVHITLSDRVRLRFEGRGYLTIISDSTEIFCASGGGGGGCAVGVEGDSLGQLEVLAGLSFRL